MDIKAYQPNLIETARLWRRLLYSKIENIFVYENMPKEIPIRFFNLCLFKTGHMVFYKIGDKYAVQPFSYNDILNWYYVPEKGRVVNPYLPAGHQNWEFTIDDEAVIYNSSPDIYNYRKFSIVSDLVWKTANQLAENDISYYCIQRNHRLIAIFTAQTDLQKREMDKVLEKMYMGAADITAQEDLVSHIQVNPISMNSTRSSITELIEFAQYILANFYHSFGINSNYNLKREQLNSNEIDVNKEVLRLNIDDMLKVREDGVSKINEKYGLNISVSLNEEVYQSLLQEVEMLQNGTIPESEVTNAQKESKPGSDSGNSNSRNINKSGSDSDSDSDSGSSTENSDRSVNEDNNNGNRSNVEQKDDNKGSSDVQSDADRRQGTEERSSSGDKNESDSGDTESSKVGTDSTSESSETDSDDDNDSDSGVNSSPITININVSNADSITVDNADTVDADTKSSQNETEDGEEK